MHAFLRPNKVVGVPWLHSACGHCTSCCSGWETLYKRLQTGSNNAL